MNNKDLLILAASAINISLDFNDHGSSGFWNNWKGYPQWNRWNSLGNDEDAFNLLVELGMFCDCYGEEIIVGWVVDKPSMKCQTVVEKVIDGNKSAAVRRAITLAAAKIHQAFLEKIIGVDK